MAKLYMNRLNEKTKSQLIDKSKKADIVKKYKTTRWERRKKQTLSPMQKDYNKVDMDSLFKGRRFSFTIKVIGETDTYYVKLSWDDLLDYIKQKMKLFKKFDWKTVYTALVKSIGDKDIYISCSCPDWQYRFAYQATQGDYNSGPVEVRASDITNPNDSKGAGCKHVLAALDDWDPLMKLAICIDNYVKYIQKSKPNLYKEIIEPTLYDKDLPEYNVTDKLEEPTQTKNVKPDFIIDDPEEDISSPSEPQYSVEEN